MVDLPLAATAARIPSTLAELVDAVGRPCCACASARWTGWQGCWPASAAASPSCGRRSCGRACSARSRLEAPGGLMRRSFLTKADRATSVRRTMRGDEQAHRDRRDSRRRALATRSGCGDAPVVPRPVQLRILHRRPRSPMPRRGWHVASATRAGRSRRRRSRSRSTTRRAGRFDSSRCRRAARAERGWRRASSSTATRSTGRTRRRADGLALRHRPVGQAGAARRLEPPAADQVRGRRPRPRRRIGQAHRCLASRARGRRSAGPVARLKPVTARTELARCSPSGIRPHHASTSSKRRPETTPKRSSRVSLARVVAGLVIPQRNRARWRAAPSATG